MKNKDTQLLAEAYEGQVKGSSSNNADHELEALYNVSQNAYLTMFSALVQAPKTPEWNRVKEVLDTLRRQLVQTKNHINTAKASITPEINSKKELPDSEYYYGELDEDNYININKKKGDKNVSRMWSANEPWKNMINEDEKKEFFNIPTYVWDSHIVARAQDPKMLKKALQAAREFYLNDGDDE